MEASAFLREIYHINKRLEDVKIFDEELPLNNTEMQMMWEIVLAKESGKRLISSRLANTLGITRSAVSQMVNKLEEREIVCRIPDKTDRKIAYIELSEKAQDIYDRMKERVNLFVRKILEKLGEEKIGNFLTSANEFLDVCGEVLREMPQAERV